MLEISLRPEVILTWGSLTITNTALTSSLVTLFLASLAIFYSYSSTHFPKSFFVKSVRVLCYKLFALTDSVTGDRKLSKQVMPLLLTFFLFILSANLLALTPGFLGSFYVQVGEVRAPLLRSPNSDLNTTLALALISIVTIQFISIRSLGLGHYLKRFFNFSNPINFVLGFFELISEGLKIFSFAFRLFGNMFAGEVLLLVVAFLVPYFLPVPFLLMEVFTGLIQAFIFTMLTLTFVKTAIIKHQ